MKHRLVAALVSVAVIVAGVAIAAQGAPSGVDPQGCRPGVVVELYADGTWVQCQTPTPSPTVTPPPSTPGPTVPPTTQPPATTTPAPTTPAPATSTPPATTPPPTPSPAGRLTLCLPRLAQCGYPHPGNTGVPAGVTLTPYMGSSRITAANAVIDGKNLPCLEIAAANVTIRNSRITGPCFWAVDVDSGSVRIEDTTIDCVTYQGTGVAGSHFTVVRSQLLRCENGADVAGGDNTIADSYIADIKEVNGGHGDGIQAYTAGGVLRNVTVRHNTFNLTNQITSSLIMGYPADNLLVEDNFFSGGAYTVYCPNHLPITNVVYRNNRFFGPKGASQGPYYGYTSECGKASITWSGNYRDYDLGGVTP